MGEADKSAGEKKASAPAPDKGDGNVTVVMIVDMHCEGCAKKVRRSVKNFDGVERVTSDCASNKLTVVGKVDPVKIKERVEEKTKKRVELVSPQPKKGKEDGAGGGGEKKPEGKPEKKAEEGKKPEEKKPKEPQVSTVVLRTRVHCDGCAQKIKKILSKYDGVQDVSVDLQKDQITLKGVMNMAELLPYLNKKLKRTVEVVPAAKKDGGGAGEKKKEGGGGGEKKEGGGGGDKKEGGGGGEKKKEGNGDGEKKDKEGGGEKKGKGGGGGGDKKVEAKAAASGGEEGGKQNDATPKVEVNKMEHYGYPYGYNGYSYNPLQGHENGYVTQYTQAPDFYQPQGHEYFHAPQMFSDENPNACSVM